MSKLGRQAMFAPIGEIMADLDQIASSCNQMKLKTTPQVNRELTDALDQLQIVSLSLAEGPPEPAQRSDAFDFASRTRILTATSMMGELLSCIRHAFRKSPWLSSGDDVSRIESAIHRISQFADSIPAGFSLQQNITSPIAATPANCNVPQASAFVAVAQEKQVILVVDDDYDNREIIRRFLASQGPEIILATNGHEALAITNSRRVDVVLLDLMMPDIDGFGVLQRLNSKYQIGELPTLMISSVDEIDKVAACIEAGAVDYILKPVNAILLRAKVRSLLERKQYLDQERKRTEQLEHTLRALEVQKRRTESLLLNVLPQKIAAELQASGCVSPTYFEDATIVFTDFVNFTASTEKMAADDLVTELNYYFTRFDEVVDRYGLEKLKTVGDSYIFLAGVPERSPSHPIDAVLASMEMLECVKQRQGHPLSGWAMRIGINTGAVIAGVVGTRKFAFDVWGDSVNFASRMVSSGSANRINISARTFHRVKDFFLCEPRGEVKIKGNRWVEMFFVDGPLPALSSDAVEFPAPAFRERYKRYFQKEPRLFKGSEVATEP